MFDRVKARVEIIKFFTEECNNKLNKNVYYKTFYAKRNKEFIYHYLQEYYKNTEFEHKSIAQKYYHIFWDIDINNLPITKFYNFNIGYRKGKRTFSSKSITYFKKLINVFKLQPVLEPIPSKEYVEQALLSYFKSAKYKQLLQQKNLLNYILNYQKDLNADNYSKLIYFLHSNPFCSCGKLRKIITPLTVRKTCTDLKCTGEVTSLNNKQRDLTYLQTSKCKLKRVQSRKWYKPTEETKQKISITNKQTWTKEKRKEQLRINKDNGVYERLSQKIKCKIQAGTYTPQTNNCLTRKRLESAKTGIKNYRSSWEVIYHECYPHLLYEYIRIPYQYKNTQHIYIVDFWDPVTKTAIEIKPYSMLNDLKTIAKHQALAIWCANNNNNYKLITEKDFNFYNETTI
jgi:hypothetical protein